MEQNSTYTKAQCNNTDINNTNYIDTDPFLSGGRGLGLERYECYFII